MKLLFAASALPLAIAPAAHAPLDAGDAPAKPGPTAADLPAPGLEARRLRQCARPGPGELELGRHRAGGRHRRRAQADPRSRPPENDEPAAMRKIVDLKPGGWAKVVVPLQRS
ncbi:MAG: hypothetical protein WDN24_20625 [Sphingomonas sp.]